MSVTFHVTIQNSAEVEALESEGAPSANMSSAAAITIVEWFSGEKVGGDRYCGTLDPVKSLAILDAVREIADDTDAWEGGRFVAGAGMMPYWGRKVDAVAEVLEVAMRLGRTVTWG